MDPTAEPKASLTLLEGAYRWRLHPETIRRAVRRGVLPHTRVLGRIHITANELEQFVRNSRSRQDSTLDGRCGRP